LGSTFWNFARRRGLTPTALFAVLAVVLLAVVFVGYYEVTTGTPRSSTNATTSQTSCTAIITTTNGTVRSTYCLTSLVTTVNTTGDVFLTSCSVTGIGEFALRIISDSTGALVSGETISAVDTLGCDILGQSPQTQVVHIDNFSAGQGGWLIPVFPAQAELGGELNFTVTYQGRTYNFSAGVPPAGTNCVTLHVPSGNVTRSTGSYCSPQSSSITQLTNGHDTISVSGLSICPSNCVYPAPYVSGLVTFNGTSPVSSLKVYVNGTYDGTPFENPSTATYACTTGAGQACSVLLGGSSYTSGNSTTSTKYYATCSVPQGSTTCSATTTGAVNTMTAFAYMYKGSLPSNFVPAVRGDSYVFQFVATFQDGTTTTATASVVAG